MTWIAKDIDGCIYQYNNKPIRCTDCWMPNIDDNVEPILMSEQEAKDILGKVIKWEDEPIEI